MELPIYHQYYIIIEESDTKILEPPEVQSKEMFIISVIGLMVNIIVRYLCLKEEIPLTTLI